MSFSVGLHRISDTLARTGATLGKLASSFPSNVLLTVWGNLSPNRPSRTPAPSQNRFGYNHSPEDEIILFQEVFMFEKLVWKDCNLPLCSPGNYLPKIISNETHKSKRKTAYFIVFVKIKMF